MADPQRGWFNDRSTIAAAASPSLEPQTQGRTRSIGLTMEARGGSECCTVVFREACAGLREAKSERQVLNRTIDWTVTVGGGKGSASWRWWMHGWLFNGE